MPFADSAHAWQQAFAKSRPVSVSVLKNVLYCPEYRILLTHRRRPIQESYNSARPPESFDLGYLFRREVEEIPGTCIIFHHLDNNYFHTLLENLPRLYTVCHHSLIKDSNQSVSLVLSRFVSESSQFFLNRLLPENVTYRSVGNGKLYRLEEVVLSSFPILPATGCLPRFYLENLYFPYRPNRVCRKINRIYISRERAYNCRHVVNEAELMKTLSRYGFKKYCLEDLSLEDQITLFFDADMVIAPHGAGLTNMIFSSQIRIIELFPEPVIFPHYYHLAKACGHHYHYMMGQRSSGVSPIRKKQPRYAKDSNFTVNPAAVEQLLQQQGCLTR